MNGILIEANGEEDEEIIREIERHKWSNKVLHLCVAFCSLDPFVAKTGVGQTPARHYGLTRKQWIKCTMIITVYLCIKPLTISLIRSMRDSSDDGHLISSLSQLLGLIGDPYSSLPNANLTIYLMPVLCALWLRCYLPCQFYHDHQYNCSSLRFLLAPREDIRQFDLRASQMLSDVIESFKRWKSSCANLFEGLYSADLTLGHSELELIEQQLDQLREVELQIHTIRPKTLTSSWYNLAHKCVDFLFIPCGCAAALFGYTITLLYCLFAWRERCRSIRNSAADTQEPIWIGCRFGEAFSAQDILVMSEMNVLTITAFMIPTAVLVNVHMLQVVHQIYLTESVGGKLRQLLEDLRKDRRQGRLEVRRGSLSGQRAVELSKNIVRVWMLEQETRECTSALAHSTKYAIGCCFMLTVATFASTSARTILSRQSSQADVSAQMFSRLIVFSAWIFIWLNANGILISCAAIPARVVRLYGTVYSIVGHLVKIEANKRASARYHQWRAHDYRISTDDPITSLWRKLILSGDFADNQASVRAFNYKINFECVLAINLTIASIISLFSMHT